MPVLLLLYGLPTGARLGGLFCSFSVTIAEVVPGLFAAFFSGFSSKATLCRVTGNCEWTEQTQRGLQPLSFSVCAPEFQVTPQINTGWQRTAVPQHTWQPHTLATFWMHVRGWQGLHGHCFLVPEDLSQTLFCSNFGVIFPFFTLCTSSLHLVYVFKHFPATEGQNTTIF